ncbi:uncharacterized protein GIQ15_00475 [Arthroderma uncinatum]|uniref:uncharacterized protein n=1 Tax=Arthroderma uncinatum TaxID=74035 RepID=UPI00144A68D4|nr:uncharacterized protein GIQ15_00475 [Arthroderma uncinatum]KAF3490958.1 hypothetical protein GIQ15_00475 [Arthroderma uncinatum]
MAEMRYISLDGPPLGGIPPQDFAYLQAFPIYPYTGFSVSPQDQPAPPAPNPATHSPVGQVGAFENGQQPPWPGYYQQLTNQVIVQQTFTAHIPQPTAPAMAPAPGPPPAQPPSRPSDQPPTERHQGRHLPAGAFPPSSNRPLVLPNGQGYIFPQKHTTIHIIEAFAAPWNNPGGTFQWRSYRVPPTMTVSELIDQLCPTHGPDGRKATAQGITECLEVGDGSWLKGSEFWVGGARGGDENMKRRVSQTLAAVGWTDQRGTAAPPVWITISITLG